MVHVLNRFAAANILSAFTFCLVLQLFCLGSLAQDNSAKTTTDTSYFENFDDWFVVKTSVTGTGQALSLRTPGYKLVLEPNTSEVIRTYFSYKFISFYFDLIPRFAGANNDNAEKGKTKLFTIGGNVNSRHWFTNLNYSKTKGYYVENTRDFRPGWKDGDPYIQVPDFYLTSYDATIGYSTNLNLSLSAASTQTERQLKSTGSFLPQMSFRYFLTADRTQASTITQSSKNFQSLAGVGYQYNFVINQSYYIVANLTPSIGYIFTKVINTEGLTNTYFRQHAPVFQGEGKLGIGYNARRFFAGTYLTAIGSKYAQGSTLARNYNADVFFQVFVGTRFVAPKLVSRTYNRIFK